ncbi:late competence development ComFB family protein [Sediminispirochaeta bajacaliforniensis]|jgi:competence protein ComFB|uniref:late competence development ComFB family protein n=1 Tax=Sediminispirochaeta bajacaliforniensis TaxID=148 RepID=UPI00036B2B84|nr:late competence development ComFB family protein [Sediminispirochaeta bajacaliforniensis]
MSLKERYNFEYLANEAERLVLEKLEYHLSSEEFSSVCKCQDCVLDMAAYALNNVRPLYRVSLMGTLYAHNVDDTDYSRDVEKSVLEAIRKISANPSHD